MNRSVLFGLLLLSSVVACASAATIEEYSFASRGFPGLSVQGANQSGCAEYRVLADANWLSDGAYAVFSIRADFLPVMSPDANVVVHVNADANGRVISADRFQDGWFRFDLNTLIQGENALSVCANTSDSTTRVVVKDDSLIGLYRMPVFKQLDFVKTVEANRPLVGDEFEITVMLHNSGSEAVDVNVSYKKPYVPYDAILFVTGTTQFVGRIAPDQTISFSYTAKSTRSGMVTVPAAIVSYTNIFGETVNLVSNYPLLRIDDPRIAIEATILNKTSQKQVFVNQQVPLEVVLRNNGLSDLYNVAVVLDKNGSYRFLAGDGAFSTDGTQSVSVLRPGETRTLPVVLTPLQQGRFDIGCVLTYQDTNTRTTACQPAHLTVEQEENPTALLAGFVLVVAAALLYLYYHFRKV